MNTSTPIPLPVRDLVKDCMNDFGGFVATIIKAGQPELSEWEFIEGSGTISRFFRRWFQTTWGQEQYCDFFNGTTPRQRLEKAISAAYLLDKGQVFISPRIDDKVLHQGQGISYSYYTCVYSANPQSGFASLPVVTEYYYLAKLLEEGLQANSNGNLTGSFKKEWWQFHTSDKDFLVWVTRILLSMGLLEFRASDKKPKIGKLFLNAKGKAYFSLETKDQLPALLDVFLNLAVNDIVERVCGKLIVNQKASIDEKIKAAVKTEMKAIFSSAANSLDWVCTDKFFNDLWIVLHRNFPNLLLSPQDFDGYIHDRKYWEKKEPGKSIFTKFAYYELGVGFDKCFLFPLDRYFGLAECVWTDYKSIMGDMQIYFGLARKLAAERDYYPTAKSKVEYAAFCDIFFSPGTAFRMREIVRS